MKIKYLFSIAIIFLSLNIFSQTGDLVNYPPKHPGIDFPPINPSIERLKVIKRFENKDWKKTWRNISEPQNNYNISVYKDQKYGDVLKVLKTDTIGYVLLEKDINLNSIRGKKIMIIAAIKYLNIQGGKYDWQKGKLCLKFNVGDITYYEDIRGLSGSEDWFTYFAHVDASKGKTLDKTNDGDYVIFVPKDATNIVLYLGLQNCSGEIFFSNIQIVEK